MGTLLCSLVLLGGCALIGMSMSETRGNSAMLGLLLGLLLGPIGLVIIALQGQNHKALLQRAVQRGELRICTRCAEAIQYHALQCPHCGQGYQRIEGRP